MLMLTKSLSKVLQEYLDCTLSSKKMNITGNSKLLVSKAKVVLGPLAGAVEEAPANLGIDFLAGRTLAQVRLLRKRGQRWLKFRRRAQTLNCFKGPRRLKARLFKASVQSVITYGAQVQGFTPREILTLRKSAAAAMGVKQTGCPMEISWSLAARWQEDPLYIAAATIERYANEWWHSTNHRPEAGPRHADAIPLSNLSTAFREAQLWVESTVGKRWASRNRGPLSDAILWLKLVGWTIESPAILVAKSGMRLVLTDVPPAVVVRYFVEELSAQKLTEVIRKKSADMSHPVARQIEVEVLWMHAARKVYNSEEMSEHIHLFKQVFLARYPQGPI